MWHMNMLLHLLVERIIKYKYIEGLSNSQMTL